MANFLKNIHPLLRRTKEKDEYDNVNQAILSALDTVLTEVEVETIESKVHSSLITASGSFLDTWGDWFGVYRKPGELDDPYRNRVIEYLNLPRGTIEAIKQAVRRFLGNEYIGVQIYEPWTNMFQLNKSKLNGPDHLMGSYYRFAVIDISIGEPFPPDLIYVINEFKPAGVEIRLNYDPSLPSNNPNLEPDASKLIYLRNLYAHKSETTLDTFNGYVVKVSGNLLLNEKQETITEELFTTNSSSLNSSARLSGSFGMNRPYYHLVGLGSNYRPSNDHTLVNLARNITEVDEEVYEQVSAINSMYSKIPIGVTSEVYFGMNLYKIFQDKYSHLMNESSSKEVARLMGDSWITYSTKANIAGKVFKVEAYDYALDKWVVLHTGFTTLRNQKKNIFIGNLLKYINGNSYLFLRLKTGGEYELNIDYFSVDYSNEIKLGYTIVKPEMEVLKANNFEKLDMDAYIGKATQNEIYSDTYYIIEEEDKE